MIAIEVEFLMGRAIATQWDDRGEAEWPPHPQRLFSALVATHADLGGEPEAEAALRWLESLPAPEIRADEHPSRRNVVSHWVPVNDEAVKVEKGKLDCRHVVERRNRQERLFPAVVPSDPTVVFQWRDAVEVELHRAALRSIVENLSYLGHSASPVRACLRGDPAAPTLTPVAETSNNTDCVLRVPGRGRFDRLQSVHQQRREDESIQPPLGRTQAYVSVRQLPRSLFASRALVLAFDRGPRLALDSTLPLMQHLRTAVLARLGDGAHELLCGHDASGRVTQAPHLAFLPLANVNHQHADGFVKGAALVLPRAADPTVERDLQRALSGEWALHLGLLGSISLRLVGHQADEIKALRFFSYAQPSKCWASVTPVVLDRFPKRKGPTAEQIVAASCSKLGLPIPVEVRVAPVPAVSGAPMASAFHGNAKQVDNRIRQHVWLRFDQHVRGPLLLGAGRFMGLGLCLPSGNGDRS